MKIRGRKITLFLIEGTPNGRWSCELSNWTGKAYKIPRNFLKDCNDRPDLEQPGVYFLLGRNDETNEQLIYIGEAENVFERLCNHLGGKDFWNEIITFVSKDKNLNKAHVKYLENRFHTIAKEAKRYQIDNSSHPAKTMISEPEQAELEEFIDNALIIVNTLGHKAFEKIATKNSPSSNDNYFYISTKEGKATGIVTTEGFVVLSGSVINKKLSEKSVNLSVVASREKYIDEKKVVNNTLAEDILFPSSSAAGVFVLGYSVSGPQAWKTNTGKTLKDFEAECKS